MKDSSKNMILMMAAITVMAAISYYFFLFQQKYPPCCDAVSYAAIAANTSKLGFLESQIPLRTFAYPLFLSAVAKVSAISSINSSLLVFMFQFGLYVAALLNVMSFFATKIKSGAGKTSMLLLLCCNVYIAPYIAIGLTDSVYASLCIIVVTNICRLFSSIDVKYDAVCATAFLAALAIVVRPTAIWLVGPLLFYFAILVLSRKVNYFKLAVVAAIAGIPLGIQIFINFTKFDVFTFFPATDLGKAQVEWGIQHLKYGTWMGGGAQPNYYPSSELIRVIPGESGLSVMWYFNNIIDGLKLVLVKFVGAFDFDFLVPYPYFRVTDFWVPSVISFAIMFFGICGVIYHAFTNNITVLGNRLLPGVIFVSWGAITLISALELRFTLPILTYFMIVSVLYIYEIGARRQKRLMLFSIGGFLALLPILIKIAMFVRDQSTISV